MVVGTGALLAAAAVLALAIGTILRRSALAVAIVIVVILVPYLLATGPQQDNGSTGVEEWLLRVTPAAALSAQQAIPKFYQVIGIYRVIDGYYPLAPWAGLAVECAWAAAALALAYYLLRRRDA